MTSGTCKLCLTESELRHGHVVPKFVLRWFKDTTPGKMRVSERGYQRAQDGPTRLWFCDTCEGRLSRWEKAFAEQFFQPIHTGATSAIRYGPWALKFAVSVSLRTLFYYREVGFEHGPFSSPDLASAERALETWRTFLLDQRSHPDEFEQHILAVDAPLSVPGRVSPYISRYLLRTLQTDVVTSRDACFTYSKLARVIVVGFIRVKSPRHWHGTKLHVKGGVMDWSDVEVPGKLADYWNERANQVAGTFASMSSRQREKINEVFTNADPGELASSEVARAIRADVQLSGEQAFKVTAPRPTKQR